MVFFFSHLALNMQLQVASVCTHFQQNFTAASLPSATLAVSVGRCASMLLQMWRYQGHKTLAHYLKRRDCLTALSEDLGVKQSAVVATVMKQLLENIAVSGQSCMSWRHDTPWHWRYCQAVLGNV